MIKTLAQALAQVGRIRIGDSVTVPKRGGKPGETRQQPRKAEAFIFTTTSRVLADWIAAAYNSTVEPWTAQRSNVQQWRVVTSLTEVRVIIPPVGTLITQHYELWDGPRCVRRCDGETELIKNTACLCGPRPEGRSQCAPYTRLNLMLVHPTTDEIPSLGVWRLDTKGYYAATRLPTQADVIRQTESRRAWLRLVKQEKDTFDDAGKATHMTWYEPQLDLDRVTGLQLTGEPAGLAIEAGPSAPESAGVVEGVIVDGPPPAGRAAAIERAMVPESELIEQAGRMETLTELEAFYRRVKDDARLTSPLNRAIVDRKAALDKAQAATEQATDGDEAYAVWMQCVGKADSAGWDTPRLMAEFATFAGHPVTEGSAAEFRAFMSKIK